MITIKQKSPWEQLNINLDTIQDEKIKETIQALFNLIENQRLRDENNRLKGEQGKPKIKSGKNKDDTKSRDISSEKERKEKASPGKGGSLKEPIKSGKNHFFFSGDAFGTLIRIYHDFLRGYKFSLFLL